MIEIIFFSTVGFLVSTLIALLAMPFLVGRAIRKAERKVREELPFSPNELAAEKDHLRAEHAVALRKLETSLEKKTKQVLAQDLQLSEIKKKLSATGVVTKSSKLALEELRSKEHELSERLRERDVKFAGLEQRTRQILRENRDLKKALGKPLNKTERSTSGDAQKELEESQAKDNSKASQGTADITHYEDALAKERLKSEEAQQKITELEQQLSIALNKIDQNTTEPRLPRAVMPHLLSGKEDTPGNNKQETEDLAKVQEQLLDAAAQFSALTQLAEGDKSPIVEMLQTTSDDSKTSLAARMRGLIKGAEVKQTTATRKTTKKPAANRTRNRTKTAAIKRQAVLRKKSPAKAGTNGTSDNKNTEKSASPAEEKA